MKLLYTIFLTCSFYFVTSAQTFSTSLIVPEANDNGFKVFQSEDGLHILSVSAINNSFPPTLGLFKTDFEGNLEWHRFYDSLAMTTLESAIMDGNYIYINGFSNNDTINIIRLIKLDLDGNVVQTWPIGEGYENEVSSKLIRLDEQFVAYHRVDIQGNREAWLQFYDLDFNLIEEHFYPESDAQRLLARNSLIKTNDNKLLGFDVKYVGFLREPLINKISNDGEIEWTANLDVQTFQFAYGTLAQSSDGTAAIGWYKDTTTNDFVGYPSPPPAVYGMTPDGVFTWHHDFEVNYDEDELKQHTNMIPTANGDFVGMGFYRFQNEEEQLDECGWIYRISSEGELLWERQICDNNTFIFNQFFYNAVELDDGSLVFTGMTNNESESDVTGVDLNIWLVRVDSMGCLEPGCDDFQVITDVKTIPLPDNINLFTAYPNPANEVLHIRSDFMPLLDHGQIQVLNTLGQVVAQQSYQTWFKEETLSLNVSTFVKGLYTYQIINRNGQILHAGKFFKN